MAIPTKTSKSELRKKSSKAKQINPIPEKTSKKVKTSSPTKPVSLKKVKHQPKEAEIEKAPKNKTRSSDAISTGKTTTLKKSKSSTESKHKSSSPSLTTKNATKKSKQTSNAAIITTTSNATKTTTNVKKREKIDSHKDTIKSTVEKNPSTKKLKKQSSAHTLHSQQPPPPPSTPIPAKRPPLKQYVSVGTSTSIGVDMSTQTDPIVESQLLKPTYQSHYLDIRDLVPVNALKITLEELMDSMQVVEKQRAAIPIKKQATIKSILRKALKSIKI
ncbi:hypothetical protein V8B55DRAFT_1490318 [Mucor lusitanicus]|uniref:Uncharacterized protein n=1 Tax=Mucor circinelloides f. lusitanicus TaxID=29924 RepID=A0A8H4BQE8_MUCCL|nr:hypothetical protein FB192DRAFT_1063613 [Mucor lusitanicus]